jgi:hypothetical protein
MRHRAYLALPACLLAATILIGGCDPDSVVFEAYSDAALQDAKLSGRPIVIKATADW